MTFVLKWKKLKTIKNRVLLTECRPNKIYAIQKRNQFFCNFYAEIMFEKIITRNTEATLSMTGTTKKKCDDESDLYASDECSICVRCA